QIPYFITNHKNDNLNLLFKDFRISHFSLLSTETKIKRHGGPDAEFNLKVKENIHMPVSIFKLLLKSTISLPPSVESTYFHCMGFEFDPKSDDYKVLVNVINRVHNEERIISFKYINQIHLYSLSTDSWREISHPKVLFYGLHHLFITYINGTCHYINGICHWLAFGDSGDLILSFDMAEEVFSTSRLPNFGMSRAACFWYIASFNEALATIVHPRRGMEKCYDIWVLNGYLWTKQLTVGPILGVGRPLVLRPDTPIEPVTTPAVH
ncbi:PREDICTED: F-box/kelch-repeat protein At3g06240-like, partial [Theobroma cacao]|uniref:F-box/kelch-repeat protein At3g06240-like n=1 Tax=Theobroma cacao TaxID=3641 RepID=A0AB32X0Z1_THECC